MRKFLTFLMLLVLMAPYAVKADELIVGTGTDVTREVPFCTYYSNSWNETIYPAAEIGQAGMINSLSYYCTTPNYSMNLSEMRIYLGVTDRDQFSWNGDWLPESELTMVYQKQGVKIGGVDGWQTFELDTPFVYEGVGNLVVVIAKSSSTYSAGMRWQYTDDPGNCLYVQNDWGGSSYLVHQGSRTGGISSMRANVKFDITPMDITCYSVKSVTGVSSTENTITISWTPSEGQTAWDVYVAKDGNAPDANTVPTATNVTETEYTFDWLYSNTTYKFFVRGNCGESVSIWKGASYKTLPDFGGAGTEEDPYRIYSKQDLQNLADIMKSGFNTAGKYFLQMNDIETITFSIGDNASIPFKGTYDGNGYSVDIDLYGDYNRAFFTTVGAGAVIKNLTITGESESWNWQTAGVVAYIDLTSDSSNDNVVIENCVNRASVKSNGNNAGGIIADFNSNGNHTLYIKNCVNYGTITGASGSSYAGGIAGRLQINSHVDNCVNYGSINGVNYLGGVVAYPRTNVVISNSANKGTVTGTSDRIGGISGYTSSGIIINCYNIGEITGASAMGGIIGRVKSGGENLGVVYNVYNAGKVNCTSNDATTTGAIFGFNEGATAVVSNAYYLEGVYGNAYGSNSLTDIISNVSSFTRSENLQTNYILANEIAGTTDLITALNSFEIEGRNEWFADIHGNNDYYPTFVVGNSPGIEFDPSPMAMGTRPIGANVPGKTITMKNTGSKQVEVTLLELESNAFFTLDENIELPLVLEPGTDVDLYVNTKPESTIEAGEVSTGIAAMWNNMSRLASVGEITATAYEPAEGDVVETAQTVNAFPFLGEVSSTNVYNNYNLPGNKAEAKDVVYEINVTEDVLLNANVIGNNNKIAVYAEDLGGAQYPGQDNNYTGVTINEVAGLDYFYFNQAEMITHPGQGWQGKDVSANVLSSYGLNINKDWYLAADDFSSDEDFTINEMEFFAYQTGSSTVSTMTGLYLQIYDGNPMEGANVVWGDMAENVMTYTEWTGAYRTDPLDLLNTDRPIMSLVASDLNIELEAGTYWVVVGMSGTLSSGPYIIPRSINGVYEAGNALRYADNTWSQWTVDGYGQGLTMIIKENGAARTDVARNELASYSGKPSELFETSATRGTRGEAAVYGGDNAVENVVLTPGKYYVVASSSSADFAVEIDTETIPVPEAPVVVYPQNMATGISDPLTLRWTLGQYTTEYQLLVGGAFPPTQVVQDWTTELANGYILTDLNNNQNYFWQINERNASGVTEGPIWAFTTSFNVPQGLEVTDANLYPGDDAVLTWASVGTRTHRGYNVYQDDVKINKSLVTGTSFTVSDLAYNQEGYEFRITAVYDEGESEKSLAAKAYMTGYGEIEGYTFEQDGVTPIPNVTVKLSGFDQYSNPTTATFVSDENGYYSGELLAGKYSAKTTVENYQDALLLDINVTYDMMTSGVNFAIFENYLAVADVKAEEIDNSNVNVYWSWNKMASDVVDFETGDFSQAEFNNAISEYPWEIVEGGCESNYAMKSTCEGVDYGVSAIEVLVDVPMNGVVGFDYRVSSEAGWDLGNFYIDGELKLSVSGQTNWTYKQIDVTEGTHTYKWEFVKDVMDLDPVGEDAFFIDNISFYGEKEPFTGGWIHYDDGVYASCIGTGSAAPCYWAVAFPAAEYAGFSIDKVSVFDAPDAGGTGTATVGVYLGGETAPGTLVTTKEFQLTNSGEFIEIALDTPVAIDGTQMIWVVAYAELPYPAAGCVYVSDPNSDWISLDGVAWQHAAADYYLNYSWMIRANLTNAKGQTAMLTTASKAPKFEGGVSTGTFAAVENVTPIKVGVPASSAMARNENSNRALQSYKLYRVNQITGQYTEETVEIVADEITDTTFIDTNWGTLESGVYKWGVAAVYEGNRTSSVNNAKSFVPGPDFVAESQKALEFNGNTNIKDFDPSMLRGEMAYANVVYPMNMPEGYVAFDIENPMSAVAVANVIADRAGEYYDGVFYGYDSNNTFYKINPATGEILSQSTVSAAPAEMAYDYSTGTMYGVSDDMLYTIDLESGNITSVGSLAQTFMAFGIDLAGTAYGVELGSGDFYSINLASLATSRIGATGLGCNYLQTGGFDHNTEIFYWFQCYDANNMGLYSIDVTTGATSLVAPGVGEVTSWFVPYVYDPNITIIYPFQDSNESAIVWSATIDKDMFTTVDVTLATDNGDSPAGAVVEFINVSEPGMGYDYVVTVDETGAYSWDNFRKGDYMLTISLSGFVSCAMDEMMEIWDATDVNCTMEEIAAAVAGLYVSPTGWAMWEQSTGDNGDEVEFGFEEGLEGWTTIDADGDGFDWVHSSGLYNEYGAIEGPSHSGAGHILSGSFHFEYGELAPDNYIVSPEKLMIGGNSVFTFWASAQDAEYPTEHFGVAVSTTGNTSADDFTTIWEETMVAKGSARVVEDGTRGHGTWYEYKVDLREYAGQSIYVAFRHFNSFDQFLLRIDDVKLANRASATAALTSYTVMLNDYEEAEVTTPYYQHENLIGGEQYTTTVIANYATGESEAMSYTWDYMDCSNFAGATEFTAEYANGNAVLNWTLPGGNDDDDDDDNDDETAASWDFEDGALAGWVTIDADGDGNTWFNSNDLLGPGGGHNGSNYYAMSESYINYVGPLNPDNYLATAEKYAITAGSKISFYACAQDEDYPYEHFGVAVSTAGNTSASDFTTISEWTISAKGGRQGERGMRQSSWTKYEADLSAYAGQSVYVAIRHFNCTDQYLLDIDDVEITTGSKESKEGTWAYYDNGVNEDAIGGPSSFSWAIKLRAADIADLGVMTKVAAFDRLSTTGTFDICLGGDNEPGASVLNQNYTFTGINDFVEITLNEVVDPQGQNVWIVFNTNDGVNYPAAECSDTGDADGRWIYLASDGWFDVTEAGIPCTWMLRGYFEEGGDNPNDDVNVDLLGVMVYRDGELLTPQPLTTNTFTEPLAETGEYEYCIRVVHGGAMDTTYYAMSCPQCETVVAEMACDAPENLYAEQAEQDGKSGVSLVWPFAEPVSEWLYYDNGTNEDAIGGPESFQWGIMFPAESLAAYQGSSFTKVSLFDYAASSGDIKIYYGGTNAPQELVHSQPYSVSGTGAFVEFDLTAALPIDPTLSVWVTFTTSQGTSYPAAVCANTGDPNGRWISLDGAVWEDLLDYSLDNTWMMRAFVSNAKGEVSSLSPIVDNGFTATGGELKVAGAARAARALDHYNVYRSTTTNNFEVIAETTEGAYFDELTESGTYYYQVTAVYVDGDEECESDPANSYSDPTQNYVSVEFVSIDENGVNGMMIYPNPTKGDLNINAESMTRITITNALGQTMYDQEVDTDNEIINMAQYEAGVYMVRIVTENGVAVKRITVVR